MDSEKVPDKITKKAATHSDISFPVTLSRKVVIEPGDTCYALVSTKGINPIATRYIFEPSRDNQIIFSQDSILTLPVEDFHDVNKQMPVTSNTTTNATNVNNVQNMSSQPCNFHICLTNLSNDLVHVNKGKIIGNISIIEKIKELKEQNQCLPNGREEVNLIQASDEIIKARKAEFSVNDFDLKHLSYTEKNAMQEMLAENFSAFSKSLNTLGHTDHIVPRIKFNQDFPIKTLPFPIPQALQEEALGQLNELLEAGIIERNVTEWAAPMLLVKKKDDGSGKQRFRLALDLRLVNSIIQFSSYPLPKIQDIISNISQFSFFTTLDLQQAYHQINLPSEYQDKLSFVTPWGTFKYKRLVFGLKTAASTFQALIDKILEEVNLLGVYAYQDDIIICANSFEESIQKTSSLLDTLRKYNITLSSAKCKFHCKQIDYLGFRVSCNMVTPIQSNIIKIKSFPTPKTRKQVKRFLGLCGYYRHLIPLYAKLTHPLVQLTCPKVTFAWTQEHQEVFEKLQQVFFNEPFVRQPEWDKPFLLNTDASKLAISAVLLQEHEGQLHPVSYFSKTLNSAQAKYPALKLELMAIVHGVNAFKHYLYCRHFTIMSDSKPLQFYKKTTSPADITTRWLMQLSEYSFNFKYVKGEQNVLPDYFSRIPVINNQETVATNSNILQEEQILPVIDNIEQEYINNLCCEPTSHLSTFSNQDFHFVLHCVNKPEVDPEFEISNVTFLKEQLRDPSTSKIYNQLLNNSASSTKDLFIHPVSKVLMQCSINPSENSQKVHKIVVPTTLKKKALLIAHHSHFGIKKTYEFLSARYFWKGMYVDCINYVTSCTVCITSKHHVIPSAPLQESPLPKMPGQYVSMDLVGPFSNNKSILTIIDHFSKHLELYPIQKCSSFNVVQALFKYISTHGRPAMILSDLGTQFTAEVFNTFNQVVGVKLIHTTSGHPQANAVSERINTSIKSTIKSLQKDGRSFDYAIQVHKSLYNNSVHSTTELSPNIIHFGRQLATFLDVYDPTIEPIFLDASYELCKILKELQVVYQQVYQSLCDKQLEQNHQKNKKAKLRDFKPGDFVYLKSKDKFRPTYNGPYKIIKKHSDVTFSIQLAENEQAGTFKIHCDRLFLAPPRLAHLSSEINQS